MWIPRLTSAFRRRLRSDRIAPAALAAMARFPSYRAPSVADLRDEHAAQSPGPDAPLEEWGAQDIDIRDGMVSCSLSGRAFIAMGQVSAPTLSPLGRGWFASAASKPGEGLNPHSKTPHPPSRFR